MKKLEEFAPLVLRVGLALVMYWFGFFQIRNPDAFAGLVPDFVANIFGSAATVSFINGIVEVILATLLLLGLFTKVVAWLLAIHMAGITVILGWSPNGARDFGLTVALIAIALHGPDKYSLDRKFRS